MKPEDVRTFIARFFEMANSHDFDRMPEFLHVEVSVNGTPTPRAAIIAQFHAHAAAVPDLSWTIEDLVAEPASAAVRLTDAGTPTSTWMGLPPTGARVSFTETAFYKLQNKKLKSMTFLADMDTLKTQLAGQPAQTAQEQEAQS